MQQKPAMIDVESCAEIFRDSSGLRILKCRICGHTCNQKGHFINHYRTHTGEKPFACPLCHYRAKLKHHLDCHLSSKHGIIKKSNVQI